METLRATEPLRFSGVVVIPVQRACVEGLHARSSFRVHARAEPVAVVVAERGRWKALDLTGEETPLEPLLRETTGLAEAVRMCS